MHPSPGHVFERRVFHVEHTVTDEPTTAVGCALAPEPQFTENTVAVGRGSPTLVDVGRFGHTTSAGAVRSGSGGRRGGARSTLAAHSLRGIDDASATRRPPNGRTLIGDERSHRKSGSVVCPPPGSRDRAATSLTSAHPWRVVDRLACSPSSLTSNASGSDESSTVARRRARSCCQGSRRCRRTIALRHGTGAGVEGCGPVVRLNRCPVRAPNTRVARVARVAFDPGPSQSPRDADARRAPAKHAECAECFGWRRAIRGLRSSDNYSATTRPRST